LIARGDETITSSIIMITFDKTIRILNADDTVTERIMNVDGGYYDMDVPQYGTDDDDGSMSFGAGDGGDDDHLAFLDAKQDDEYDDMDLNDVDDDDMSLGMDGGDMSGYFDAGGSRGYVVLFVRFVLVHCGWGLVIVAKPRPGAVLALAG
jgi:hypothetical protein